MGRTYPLVFVLAELCRRPSTSRMRCWLAQRGNTLSCSLSRCLLFQTSLLETSCYNHACRTCHETKPATDFFRYTISEDGLRGQCKICCAQAQQPRAQQTPQVEDKVRQCYVVT